MLTKVEEPRSMVKTPGVLISSFESVVVRAGFSFPKGEITHDFQPASRPSYTSRQSVQQVHVLFGPREGGTPRCLNHPMKP
jgi:hypothetical protein